MPKRAISFIANSVYHENYFTIKKNYFFAEDKNDITVRYRWKHLNKWNTLEEISEPIALPMRPVSEEEFIAEHYCGYSAYKDDSTFDY